MTNTRKYLLPFPACCGAGIDPDAEYMKSYKDPHEARRLNKVAFVFSDVSVDGSEKICEGLYLLCPDNRDWSPEKLYEKVKQLDKYPINYGEHDIRHVSLVYPSSGTYFKDYPFIVFYNFLNKNFPNYEQRMAERLKVLPNLPCLAITANSQHTVNEPILLELGFKVFKRKTSPKTESKLTLYYKEPVKI